MIRDPLRSHRLVVALTGTLAVAPSAAVSLTAAPIEVRVTLVDGAVQQGNWEDGADPGELPLRTAERVRRIPFDDLLSLRKDPLPPVQPPTARTATVYLADGGMLHARLAPGNAADEEGTVEETVLVQHALLGAVRVPFPALAAIDFTTVEPSAGSSDLFRSAMSDRRPGEDLLLTRGVRRRDAGENGGEKSGQPGAPQIVAGSLVSLSGTRGSFHFGDRVRTFEVERIYGIVFARGASAPRRAQAIVTLVDGSRLAGNVRAGRGGVWTVTTTFGPSFELPVGVWRAVEWNNERVVYLSDLTPTRTQFEGVIHRDWPVRFDRSVVGAALSIDGREYAKGIGVHSRTTIEYALAEPFERLLVDVGIDDFVRPRGDVEFRVLGDDRVLHAVSVTGSDPPQALSIDVGGVRRLVLVVDYGRGLDVADHADWADARLIRPKRATDQRE